MSYAAGRTWAAAFLAGSALLLSACAGQEETPSAPVSVATQTDSEVGTGISKDAEPHGDVSLPPVERNRHPKRGEKVIRR